MSHLGPLVAPAVFDTDCEDIARAAVRTAKLYAPGLTDDDLLQEARVGIWQAIGDYDDTSGVPFEAFAFMVARRRLVDAVTAARRLKHKAFNDAMRLETPIAHNDGSDLYLADVLSDARQDPCRTVLAREAIREVAARMGSLTAMEQEAVLRVCINGEDYATVGPYKQVDNAMQRARRKLNEPRSAPAPRLRSVFVDRAAHPDSARAVAAALKVCDGQVLEISKRKLLDGKERAPQGRPDRHGRRGQAVWRIDILPTAAAA